jgi:S1-C subfamily serine protease
MLTAAILFAPVITIAQDTLKPREIYRKAGPAVVIIMTPTSQGSGVLVDPSGLIVTNLHVIDESSQASVTLANGDVFDDVRVVDYDPRRDLVVLKIKGERLPTVEMGDSDLLETGDEVYAIGAPKGLGQTLSAGIVSAVRDSGEGYRLIQTTTPISPGSSGGGLFDIRGRLVGITESKFVGENLNFAIPINYVRSMLREKTPRLTLAELKARLPRTRERTAPT